MTTRGSPMSLARKIAHKAEVVKGRAKKSVGRLTGNRRLQAQGRREEFKGNAKRAGTKVKDAFRH